ncbi:DUF732 domain-containing protein [Mycolicibacterium sp. CBMA 226]|uniref:DUF732 domain-containing protein n=1 Tax=Mycolicibacterium sp. CBMA 226 TaxID=2606611 RepID=UPI0012DE826D|nr:DUF732 domain-containing protein [Mycolicibacterium sp. CBMA 226]
MADFAVRSGVSRAVLMLLATSAGFGWAAPSAHADPVTYVNSVNVRPGFNFQSGDAAIAYGRGVCDKIAAGRSYGQIIGDIKVEQTGGDDGLANYLVGQIINELCPELIGPLRNSAANYRPGAQ